MSQPPGGGPSRSNSQLSYIYDSSRDELVFETGRRIPRPPQIPISSLPVDNRTPRTQPPFPYGYNASSSYQGPNTPLSYHQYSPTQTTPTAPNSFYRHQPAYRSSARGGHVNFQRGTQSPSVNNITSSLVPLSLNRPDPQHGPAFQPHRRSERLNSVSQTIPPTANIDLSNATEEELKLYSSFKRRKQPRIFFSLGKVFLTLWSEPAGDSGTAITSGISKGRFGEQVHSKIRRFIVVRVGHESCTCLPILTYQGQGVARKGVCKSDHAIIHTTKEPPAPTLQEAPSRGESGMMSRSIRVDVDVKTDKLDEMSRVNFGKHYTIEHKAKVKSLGKVNRDSLQPLLSQTMAIWTSTAGPPRQQIATIQRSGSALTEVEWVQAFQALVGAGFSEERARAMLPEPSGDAHDESEDEEAGEDDGDESEPESDGA